MCGRYTFIETEELKERFELTNSLEFDPRYNISPGSTVPVVTKNSPKKARLMRWGLVPAWAKDPRIGYRMINARAEEIEIKPAFRVPFRERRCLIPANGFYEWQREDNMKIPHYFYPAHGGLMAFAGVYDIWKDAEGKELYSYTIITTEANDVVASIHNRMPAILTKQAEEDWLEGEDVRGLKQLLTPIEDTFLKKQRVKDTVNNPRNESPSLIEPVE